jgi:hypothetical protein
MRASYDYESSQRNIVIDYRPKEGQVRSMDQTQEHYVQADRKSS